jgi:hypothetical protein
LKTHDEIGISLKKCALRKSSYGTFICTVETPLGRSLCGAKSVRAELALAAALENQFITVCFWRKKFMYGRVLKSLSGIAALVCLAALPVALAAQDSAKPAAPSTDNPSKWDIFLGYSYLAPHGTVNGTPFNAINYGAIGSLARYFNKYVGVQAEVDEHYLSPENGYVTQDQPQDDFEGGGAGLIFRYPTSDITPFVHALVGMESAGSYTFPEKYGVVLTAGGGLDYSTPLLHHHLAIRVFQADYQYTHEDFGPAERGNFNMVRLSAGLVYHIGSIVPPPPVTLACSASPATIFPGDPVTITATPGMLDPKANVIYTWSGVAGLKGNGTTATLDSAATGSLTAGTYTVKGEVKEGKAGKEGLKPGETADCSATITVKAFEPPTVSCSASPSTINPGATSTITASGVSPQNRPLTYSYTAVSGTISGTGTSATFNSTGAPTGAVGITCNVSDDKGQTASANTTVTITAPYVAPAPHTQALCSISFSKDTRRPTRVDNEAKACLDQVALDLQNSADAKAVIVGESDAKEKAATEKEEKLATKHKHVKVVDSAAERAVNTKEYLVTEKGIDPSRVSVATGTTDGQTVEDYLVPAGATFSTDVTGTTPVDETVVKPVVRKPLGEKPHHHKKKAEAAN